MPEFERSNIVALPLYPQPLDPIESACRVLWAHVLILSIEECAAGNRIAEVWLQSKNEAVGSFLWICQELSLNPALLSDVLATRKKRGPKRRKKSITKGIIDD